MTNEDYNNEQEDNGSDGYMDDGWLCHWKKKNMHDDNDDDDGADDKDKSPEDQGGCNE